MKNTFTAWKTSRKLYSDFVDKYSIEQLNTIPPRFKNNLVWNIGHIIVAQQALIYKGSNLQGHIPDHLYDKYKPGTVPLGNVTKEEVAELKHLLTATIKPTIADFNNNIFTEYNERMTGTGFYLKDVLDAFAFNNYHEGLHLGYMMGIRRFV